MTAIEQNIRFANFRRNRYRRNCSLEIRDVTLADDNGTPLLDDISLELQSGSKTCIVGASPRSQAALVALLVGEQKPRSGLVYVNGLDVGLMSREALADTVAYVPRSPWLKRATITENMTFGLEGISKYQVEWAARLTKIDVFARYLPEGLDTVVSDGSAPGTIVPSLGQRRRITLARALLRNPSILILEDPTAGLGVKEEEQFAESLEKIMAGRTLLCISHRLSVAKRADQVFVLSGRQLIEYNETETRGQMNDHSKLWDRMVPPTPVATTTRRQVLRVARPTPVPISEPWGIRVGKDIVPGYVASSLLERSQYTDVWAAWSTEREAPVRVKVPGTDPVSYQAHEQLNREYRSAKALKHPGLATAHDADLDGKLPFTVFEYLDSPSLTSIVGKHGQGLDPLDVLYIGFELAGALHYLHRCGFVHLNIRGRHVRTRADTIVLSDLSHCRRIGSLLPTHKGSGNGNRGEHSAVAPEQHPGATADPKMDVYSLGALMHFAAAGVIQTDTTSTGQHLRPLSSLLDSAPTQLTSMVDRMLAPDPADRPDSQEILDRFGGALPQSLYRRPIMDLESRSHLRLIVSNN